MTAIILCTVIVLASLVGIAGSWPSLQSVNVKYSEHRYRCSSQMAKFCIFALIAQCMAACIGSVIMS